MIKEPVILCVLTFPLLFAATVFADASNGKIQVSENEEGFRFTEDGADDHIDALTKKYLDQDKYPNRQPGEVRVIYKIEAERVSTMG